MKPRFATLIAALLAALCAVAHAQPAFGDPLVAAAGDIACDPDGVDFNGGLGTNNGCHQQETSDLLLQLAPDAVLMLGDAQYEGGRLSEFTQSYDPSWGRLKEITRPIPGNHEYHDPGAPGYFEYFGENAGEPGKGYYSYDLGAWHLIALNSNCDSVGGCAAGSEQEQWLRADLATHPASCTLAYWHAPLFSSGPHGSDLARLQLFDLWRALSEAGADVVLNAHDHDYERFAPQDAYSTFDPERGMREFVSGGGGKSHYPLKRLRANSEVFNGDTFGVLSLTLRSTSYEWRFVPEAGSSFTDAGSASCHFAPVNTTTPAITGTPQAGEVLSADLGTWTAEPAATYSYQWRRCDAAGLACTPIPGATDATYRLTSDDVDWRVRVRVMASNMFGSTVAASKATAAVMGPPVNVAAPVISGVARDGELLTADTGVWRAEPAPEFTYQWRRCDVTGLICSPIAGATQATYRLTPADVGWPVRVRVYATNAFGSAYSPANATEAVVAAPPVSLALPVIAGTAQAGEVLTADTGTWAGTPPLNYGYQWRRCDAAGLSCTAIPDATAVSYRLTQDDVGLRVRVRVYATNAVGSSYAASKATTAVMGVPVNLVAPAISGTARNGEVLTADTGVWRADPAPTYSYQWRRCDEAGLSCVSILGATDASYRLTADDVGARIRVRVYATNFFGSAYAPSKATDPVAIGPPVNEVQPLISGNALDGEVLSTDTGVWSGAATLVYTYQWRRCDSSGFICTSIGGATDASYRLTAADVGWPIRVRVYATNAFGSAYAPSKATALVAPARVDGAALRAP